MATLLLLMLFLCFGFCGIYPIALVVYEKLRGSGKSIKEILREEF